MCYSTSQGNGYHKSNGGQPLTPEVNNAEVSFNLKVQRGQIHDWLHVLMVAVPDDQKVPMKLMEARKTVDFKRQKLVQVSLPLNENRKCSWGSHLKRIRGLVEKVNALKWKIQETCPLSKQP